MSRKIFKNRDSIPSSPFQFQSNLTGFEEQQHANALEAEAELDAFSGRESSGGGGMSGFGGNFGQPGGGAPSGNSDVNVQNLIDQAQADVDAIVGDAKGRAAEIEQEAYQKGLDEGRKTGEIMADQQLQAALNIFHNSIERLDKVRELMVSQLQLDIVDLVIHTAEKVIKTELQSHPNTILHMARDAIRGLKERKNLVLLLNQEDHNYIHGIAEAERQTWLGTQVSIEVDPTLPRGSFRIETPSGELDALIETQLRQINEELQQSFGGS